MITVTTHEAKTHLSKLLKKIQEGEEVIIRRGDICVARLVPIIESERKKRPKVGAITSKPVQLTADAFEPLSDTELTDWDM